MHNVLYVLLHAKQNMIVLTLRNKNIRVGDATKPTDVQTFHHEHYRFQILASHPEINFFASGHDCGVIIFKLERERSAFSVSGDSMFFAKDRALPG